jgi:hypothetical protein
MISFTLILLDNLSKKEKRHEIVCFVRLVRRVEFDPVYILYIDELNHELLLFLASLSACTELTNMRIPFVRVLSLPSTPICYNQESPN